MANEIHNYPLQIYSIGENDYLDVDFYNGLGYDSSKILGRDLKSGKATMITTPSPVTGTGEQSIIGGTWLGSLSVPANFFQVGDTFRFVAKGMIGAHNNDTLTFRIESNGTILLSTSGAITMPDCTSKAFSLTIDFCIRAIGAAGTANIMTAGSFVFNKDSNNIFEGQEFHAQNITTFDTTILNTLDVTAQFSSANVQNQIETYVAYLEKVF